MTSMCYRWFDADTLILNPTVPWTLFLPPSDFNEIHMLATQDQNGFNAGMAMFRVHEWSVQMLAEVVALRQLRPEVHFDFFDQGATRWVMEREGYQEHVIYQPHDWWNAFGLNQAPYQTDAFMLHFAGADCCGQEDSKGTVMGRWLDILENNPQAYAVELEKTKLPKQVQDYWAMLRKAKKTLQDVHKAEMSHDLQVATNELWTSYSLHANNATGVTLAIKKVEDTRAGKPSQAKKEGESAKKEEKPAKKEDESAKTEAVETNKNAAQEKAPKREPAPPAKDNR